MTRGHFVLHINLNKLESTENRGKRHFLYASSSSIISISNCMLVNMIREAGLAPHYSLGAGAVGANTVTAGTAF